MTTIVRDITPVTPVARPEWLNTQGARPTPLLTIVVPTYREAENIEPLVNALHPALAGVSWEVVFVDDDSPDGTMSRVRELSAKDSRIRGIRRLGRKGLSGAVIEGFLSSSSEFVAVMDGDLQHDERVLPQMLSAAEDGADLVVATRYGGGGSSSAGFTNQRQFMSTAATWLAQKLLKTRVSDPMSGFFLMRRSTFEKIAPRLSTGGFKLLLDVLSSSEAPLKIVELPFSFRPRVAGDSKLTEAVAVEYLGLLLSKVSGGAVSPRFLMFAAVGASGLAVHLAVLKAAFALSALPFDFAQLIATYTAMLWNFILNNRLTYRDRRLRGLAAVKGFLSFAAVCSVGTIANIGVAKLVYANDPNWLIAGIAGALMAAVFNYAVSSVFTWSRG